MKSFQWQRIRGLVLLVGVLAVGLVLGMGWSRWHQSHEAKVANPATATASVPTGSDGRRVLYWHDPMKPDVRFDKPGKSPYMDMPLQPVYAADGGAAEAGTPTVRVSAAARQQLGIRLGRVERAALAPVVNAVGIVAYDETAQAVVQPRVDGYLWRLRVRAPLETVKQGQVLADVDFPMWREALGEYLALPDASDLRPAVRQRLVVLGVPDGTVRQVEQSRTLPGHFELVSPVAGVVTELALRDGAAFAGGTVLVRVNRIDRVWVDAQLSGDLARAVAPGASVHVRADARPGRVFDGRVLSILPQLDPVTRTVGVRVSVDNPGSQLSPGMFVTAVIAGRAGGLQLWVPSEAIITTGERSVVIVVQEAGGFGVAEVATGAEMQGRTAILSGLTEGQSVVLSGQFLIDSEANLKSAINRLTAAGASR